MASARATKEFSDYPLSMRAAISIGRLVLAPEIEMAGALANDDDLFGLKYYPLQV